MADDKNRMAYRLHGSGWMAYPAGGWLKWAFKLPILLWRLGLSRFTPSNFLLLTTTGRKSGRPRRTMLEYSCLDGRIYLSSGWGERPQWYKNLSANPDVTVQTRQHGEFAGRAARVTDAPELARFYGAAHGSSPVWKAYLASVGIEDELGDFLDKKDRLVILRIDPVDSPPAL